MRSARVGACGRGHAEAPDCSWGKLTLAVQSRHFLERANCESLRLRSPGFANELIRGEASEGLKASGKVVGVDEVAQMSAQFIVGLVEVAFDGGVLDGAVHPLDLTVGPGMLGLCQAVIEIVEGAGIFEGMRG